MSGLTVRRVAAMLAVAATFVATGVGSASAAPTNHTGTLPDGTTWTADIPSNWNGTLVLYSHGFGTLAASDAPDPGTQAELLSEGYALTGSSEAPPTSALWTLGTAVRDQFATLAVVEHTLLASAPKAVYAFGTSMGGLISALEDQTSNGRLAGVSWVTPDGKHSDHAGSASAEGPSWVAAVVNAIGPIR